MYVGIPGDHGGFDLKQGLLARLRVTGYEVVDFGAHGLAMTIMHSILAIHSGSSSLRFALFKVGRIAPAKIFEPLIGAYVR